VPISRRESHIFVSDATILNVEVAHFVEKEALFQKMYSARLENFYCAEKLNQMNRSIKLFSH
jgi:hypothetical protein